MTATTIREPAVCSTTSSRVDSNDLENNGPQNATLLIVCPITSDGAITKESVKHRRRLAVSPGPRRQALVSLSSCPVFWWGHNGFL